MAQNKPRKIVIVDPNTGLPISISGSFLGLTDTPSAYAGQAGKTLVVNGTEDALEFFDVTGGVVFKGAIAVPADFPTLAEVQNGWLYTCTADVTDNDPTRTNTGDSFITGDEIIWNGSAWIVVGNNAGGASTLQQAYDGGEDILLAAGTPFQFRDYGAKLDSSNVFPGMYGEISSPGLAFGMVSDNTFGPPTMAVGALAITDSAVVLSGDTIDFGFDVTTVAGNVKQAFAVPGASVNFLPVGLITIKTGDNAGDVGSYSAVSVANGLATNSLVTVVDAATQASPTFTGVNATASAFNQSAGFNTGVGGGGGKHIFVGTAEGDGTTPLVAQFSDNGDFEVMHQVFNVGNLRGGMLDLINFGPLVGADADKPFIRMGGGGPFNPDNGDIQFAVRPTDPTIQSTFGPSVNVTFQNNAPNQDTITVTGGSLLGAGFKWNSDLNVSGSTSNDGDYRIARIQDLGGGVEQITLSDSGVLTNEAPGASVTLVDTKVQQGTVWFNAAEQVFKFANNNAQAIPLGGTLQTAYQSGNNIGINGLFGSFATRLTGAEFGQANFSGVIFDNSTSGLGTSPLRIISGQVGGAPNYIEQAKLLDDTSFIVVNNSISSNDISFNNANPDTIVTAGAVDFVAAGMQPGDKIDITGSTSNNTTYTIDTVTSTTITLIPTDNVVVEGAGANVTITGWTKLEFGASVNFSTLGVEALHGTYANVDIQAKSGVTVKSTDISPTDEGDLYPVVNVSDGTGTASRVQIGNPSATANPAFTSGSGNAFVATGIVNNSLQRFHFGVPSANTSGTSFGLNNVINDGTAFELSSFYNGARGNLATSGIQLVNLNTSGGADVPMIRFNNLADSADIRFTPKTSDVTLANMGDGEAFYNSSDDRLKLRANGAIESVAYLSDVTGVNPSLQDAYDNGRIVTVSGSTQPFELRGSGVSADVFRVFETSFGFNTVELSAGGSLLLDRLENAIGVHVTGNHTNPAFQATNDFNTKPFARFRINGNTTPVTVWSVEEGGRTVINPQGNVNAIDITNTGTGLDVSATNWSVSQAGDIVGNSYTAGGSAGLTGTYNFGGGGSGDVATMTFTGGILTAVTTNP